LTSYKPVRRTPHRLKLLESPREWDGLFEAAALGYRDTAVTRVVTIDSGRVWRYMKANPDKYHDVLDFVAQDEFNILAVKKRINDALKRQCLSGIWFKVPGTSWERTGRGGRGALYVNKAGAGLGIFGG
jgi:hypothetical protein